MRRVYNQNKESIVTLGVFTIAILTLGTATTANAQESTSSTTPEDFTQFRNAFFGLTVAYPEDWEVRPPYTTPATQETSILQIFAPGDGPMDGSRANVNFEVLPEWIPGMSIKEVQDRYMIRVYGGMPNVQILDSSIITLPGNIQAYMLEYSFDGLDGDNMTHVKIMSSPPNTEKTYEITFSSPTDQYEELKPVLQQILSTVRLG